MLLLVVVVEACVGKWLRREDTQTLEADITSPTTRPKELTKNIQEKRGRKREKDGGRNCLGCRQALRLSPGAQSNLLVP